MRTTRSRKRRLGEETEWRNTTKVIGEISTIETQKKIKRTKTIRTNEERKKEDDDDYVMTKSIQEYSLARKEIKYNLIDDEDDEYDNNIVCKPNQVIIRMSHNDEMNTKKVNLKQGKSKSGSKSGKNIVTVKNEKERENSNNDNKCNTIMFY